VSYAGEFTLLKGIAYPLTVEAPWTAVVGLAGIAAAFFAPTYSQRRLEQRREKREYRRAKALVLAELAEVVETLETLSEPFTRVLADPGWQVVDQVIHVVVDEKVVVRHRFSSRGRGEVYDVIAGDHLLRSAVSRLQGPTDRHSAGD